MKSFNPLILGNVKDLLCAAPLSPAQGLWQNEAGQDSGEIRCGHPGVSLFTEALLPTVPRDLSFSHSHTLFHGAPLTPLTKSKSVESHLISHSFGVTSVSGPRAEPPF